MATTAFDYDWEQLLESDDEGEIQAQIMNDLSSTLANYVALDEKHIEEVGSDDGLHPQSVGSDLIALKVDPSSTQVDDEVADHDDDDQVQTSSQIQISSESDCGLLLESDSGLDLASLVSTSSDLGIHKVPTSYAQAVVVSQQDQGNAENDFKRKRQVFKEPLSSKGAVNILQSSSLHSLNRPPSVASSVCSQTSLEEPPFKFARRSSSSSTSSSKRVVEYETDPATIARRQKQLDYGKNTVGYANYLRAVPKHRRKRGVDMSTPDKYIKYSRRSWDQQVKIWRKRIHDYDSEELAVMKMVKKQFTFDNVDQKSNGNETIKDQSRNGNSSQTDEISSPAVASAQPTKSIVAEKEPFNDLSENDEYDIDIGELVDF